MGDTFPVLFGRDPVKQGLGWDQDRRNVAMLEVVDQVKLLPVRPCQMVVGHIVAAVVVVDLVTDIVIAIETAH